MATGTGIYIPTAMLGDGTASSTKVLLGNQTYGSLADLSLHQQKQTLPSQTWETDNFGVLKGRIKLEGSVRITMQGTFRLYHEKSALPIGERPYNGEYRSDTVCASNDFRLSDTRYPLSHKVIHQSGGSDELSLDALGAPSDITTLNASTSAHGLLRKLDNDTTHFLRGDGSWSPTTWTAVIKTADQAKQSNSNLAEDSLLKFTTTANTNYHIRLRVLFSTAATPDFKYRLTHGGTTTRVRRLITRAGGDATSTNFPTLAISTAFDSSDVALTGTAEGFVYEDVILQVGASGGELAFQWAQNTSNGTATTVLEGSYLEYMTT